MYLKLDSVWLCNSCPKPACQHDVHCARYTVTSSPLPFHFWHRWVYQSFETDRKLAVFHWCRERRGTETGQDVISNVHCTHHAVTSTVFPPLTVDFITVSKTDRQLSIICQFKEERGAGTAWDLSMCGWDVRSRHLQCMCTAALTVCVHYTVCSVSTLPCVVCVHYNRW